MAQLNSDHDNSECSPINAVFCKSAQDKRSSIKFPFNKTQFDKDLSSEISSIPLIFSKKVEKQDLGFNSKRNRIIFIRKVYFIILLQLALAIGLQGVSIFGEKLKRKCDIVGRYYCYWTPFGIAISIVILLACCRFQRRFPFNYIALIIFTCSSSIYLMVAKTFPIFCATIIFAYSIAVLFIFSCQTEFDNTIYTSIAIVLTNFIIVMIIALSLMSYDFWKSFFYGNILATIFLIFFVVDIHMMVTGKHRFQIRNTEIIYATMTLYTDIVNFIIKVLEILNTSKD